MYFKLLLNKIIWGLFIFRLIWRISSMMLSYNSTSRKPFWALKYVMTEKWASITNLRLPCICVFYNILTMCSKLSANEMLINNWYNVVMTLEYNDQLSYCITMLSQLHINDCISTLLALKLEHIVKVLWKHKYMEGASLW